MEKKIIVLGSIGKSDRENRDNMRVMSRGGCCITIKAHVEKEKPMVLKKWKKG